MRLLVLHLFPNDPAALSTVAALASLRFAAEGATVVTF